MNKSDRPDWYAKAAAEPLRKTMFTQKLKQQVLDRLQLEEKRKFKWPGTVGKLAAASGIVMVLFVFLWGNMDGWFAKHTGVDPSEKIAIVNYPADVSAWNEEMVYQFLNDIQEFVNKIPKETTSKEQIIERYEKYFSPELSREIFDSLYMESEGKWKVPDGDAGYIFVVLGRGYEGSEVAFEFSKDFIRIRETYEIGMYSAIEYVIRYSDKPIITEWHLQ